MLKQETLETAHVVAKRLKYLCTKEYLRETLCWPTVVNHVKLYIKYHNADIRLNSNHCIDMHYEALCSRLEMCKFHTSAHCCPLKRTGGSQDLVQSPYLIKDSLRLTSMSMKKENVIKKVSKDFSYPVGSKLFALSGRSFLFFGSRIPRNSMPFIK